MPQIGLTAYETTEIYLLYLVLLLFYSVSTYDTFFILTS